MRLLSGQLNASAALGRPDQESLGGGGCIEYFHIHRTGLNCLAHILRPTGCYKAERILSVDGGRPKGCWAQGWRCSGIPGKCGWEVPQVTEGAGLIRKHLKTPIERGSEARFGRGGAKHVPIFLFGWGLT
jgi:hypothetical protein